MAPRIAHCDDTGVRPGASRSSRASARVGSRARGSLHASRARGRRAYKCVLRKGSETEACVESVILRVEQRRPHSVAPGQGVIDEIAEQAATAMRLGNSNEAERGEDRNRALEEEVECTGFESAYTVPASVEQRPSLPPRVCNGGPGRGKPEHVVQEGVVGGARALVERLPQDGKTGS